MDAAASGEPSNDASGCAEWRHGSTRYETAGYGKASDGRAQFVCIEIQTCNGWLDTPRLDADNEPINNGSESVDT